MYDIFEGLLKEHGVTAYQVAKATGISTGSLSDWKNGRSSPKAEKLRKIADYFNVSVDYLLGKEEKPAANSDELSEDKIKFALFGGPSTDEQYEEVKRFARYLKEQQKDEANK